MQTRICDVDGGDGLRMHSDRRPYPQGGEHAPGARREREGAGVHQRGAGLQRQPVEQGNPDACAQ